MASLWVNAPNGKALTFGHEFVDGSNGLLGGVQANFAATGAYQRVSISDVAPASSVRQNLVIRTNGAGGVFDLDADDALFSPDPWAVGATSLLYAES